jgi:amino acid transporter
MHQPGVIKNGRIVFTIRLFLLALLMGTFGLHLKNKMPYPESFAYFTIWGFFATILTMALGLFMNPLKIDSLEYNRETRNSWKNVWKWYAVVY